MSYADDIPYTLAMAAHSGTSHVPDQRAEQERAGYAATLTADLADLERHATTEEKRAILAEEFARYRQGYGQRYRAYLSARSRVMSAMIAGPSNFPTRRNAKRNATADKRGGELEEYRAGALAAIRRKLRPELAPVMAGDANALDRLRLKLAKAEQRQEGMRAANVAIRKAAKAVPDAQIAALVALGYPASIATELIKPDFAGRIGFADYQLTNNGAEIRRIKARIEQIGAAKAAPTTETARELARVEEAPADNRIRIYFPDKPPADVRAKLKRNGFRWSPTIGAWQAYINHQTRIAAHNIAGAEVAPAVEVAS